MKVGWIGLGAMGGPMAAVLARAGFDVVGADVDAARVAELVDAGGTAAGSLAEAAAGADLLGVMVATPAQAEGVLFGAGGAVETLARGATVILFGTLGVAFVESAAERLAERGIQLVDAPASGGTPRAATGDLLIMVGGPPEAIEAARPVLDACASNAPTVGPRHGDGQRVKLVNQILAGTHVAIAGEALAFAEALGLDPAATFEVVRHGAAQSWMLEDRGPRMLDFPEVPVRSAVDIILKDLRLVLEAAAAAGYEAPVAQAAMAKFACGSEDLGLGRADDSALIEVSRRWAAEGHASGSATEAAR